MPATPAAPARRLSRRRAAMTLAAVLLLAAGCRTAPPPAAATDAYDPTPRLAIISAFWPELEKLRQAAQISQVRVIHGRSHYLGTLAGHRVVLVLSGLSMVNATLTTQCLLDHFAIRELIVSGIAGGVNPNLTIGDVTVPAEWGQYQEQLFAREGRRGWETGNWPADFPNYGMMHPQNVRVTRAGGAPDSEERRFWFPVDPASLRIVEQITNTVALSRGAAEGRALPAPPRVVGGGRGVSGPTFVDNAAYRQWVWQTFHADALDMETAAVATVAYVNRVPFIAFRSLSDLAGGGAKDEVDVFFEVAAANSANVVLSYLRALDENQLPR